MVALLEPLAEIASHPVTIRARSIADQLRRSAGRVETDGVERSRLDLLAAAGLHGLAVDGTPPAVSREVAELLAGADGNTWFVWVQHASALAGLAASANASLRDGHLADATAGRTQLGLSWAHVRPRPRPAVPAVTATPMPDGGWILDGVAPWATGAGLLDEVTIGGVSIAGELVMAMIPFAEQSAMTFGPLQRLLALGGTRTVALHLAELRIGPEQVVSVQQLAVWAERNDGKSANAMPAVFGLARTLLDALADTPDGADLAGDLEATVAACRRQAYALTDDPDSGAAVHAERLRLRAQSLTLLQACSVGLLTALGGSAMRADGDASRWAREAQFHLVQAQTRQVRAAVLAGIGRATSAGVNA